MSTPGTAGVRNPLAWGGFALLMLAVPGVALVLDRAGPPPPPVLGALPPFSLVDQQGAAVTHDDLAGQVVVMDFIFTRCPDICPTLSRQMKAVGDTLGAEPFGGPPLHLVSVTVDPDFDSPAVLADYAQGYDASPDRWSFLTGPTSDIDVLMTGLAQVVERDGTTSEGAPNIAHSQRILLIDPAGQVRGFHHIDEEGLAALVQNVEALAGGK